MKNTEKKPFYQKIWFIALISCFVPIVGIVLMWKFKTNWNKIVKVILTVIASFWMLLLVAFCFADESETPADDTSVSQTTISAEKTTEEAANSSDTLIGSNEVVTNSTTTTTYSTTEFTAESTTTTSKSATIEKSTATTKTTTTTDRLKPTTTTTKKSTTTTTENPEAKITVYVTATGKKYHYENPCGNGKYYASTLAEAKSRGLTKCEKCVLH